jgi:predicted small secreted protein
MGGRIEMRTSRCISVIAILVMSATLVACCNDCGQPTVEGLPYEAATFEIEGETAFMYGVIDHTTPEVVQALVDEHPEVTRIVMVDVPGSDDDPANLKASRLVRENGLTTVVPSNGVIASGGVDFFTAGKVRVVESCGKLGVHSWNEDGPDGSIILGNEVPRDHEIHTMFLEFYREMEIPEDFYWFTLEAAPALRIHWMSDEEIVLYGLITEVTQ